MRSDMQYLERLCREVCEAEGSNRKLLSFEDRGETALVTFVYGGKVYRRVLHALLETSGGMAHQLFPWNEEEIANAPAYAGEG